MGIPGLLPNVNNEKEDHIQRQLCKVSAKVDEKMQLWDSCFFKLLTRKLLYNDLVWI